MIERIERVLYNPQQAHGVWAELWMHVKAATFAGHRLVVKLQPATRSLEQNAMFHGICAALARSPVEWAGKRRSAQQWKTLLVSGHAVVTREEVEMIPGLESEFLNIRESTALMSRRRATSLIEYALAFCAEHGVSIPAPAYHDERTDAK